MEFGFAASVGAAVVGVALGFTLSLLQAFIGARVGSDHPVHVFLTRAIRSNGNRLFVRIPDLLNTCYCAAMPLYLHLLVSRFRDRVVFWLERLLNPTVNALHVVVFALIAEMASRQQALPSGFVGLATCTFALTPQFFHALSARNFGLSSRGSGLLLLTLFFLVVYAVEARLAPGWGWPCLALLAWLIWGFNTFAQQTLCIFSVLLLLAGRPTSLLGGILGLAVFVALHPAYSVSYLRNTLRFIRTYARELAPIYILKRRTSIWRDLVWDIWRRFEAGPAAAIRYAYENSIVVVALLNPLVLVGAWMALSQGPAEGLVAHGARMSLMGFAVVLLTSFRATRFLGEPERYAEVVTPWATLAAVSMIGSLAGAAAMIGIVVVFLSLDALQLLASRMLLKRVAGGELGLIEIERAVSERFGDAVRFCSNNEQITKKLMQNDWKFAYYLAAGQDYAGLSASEVFSTFPFLRKESCELIAATYRVNACLLDREAYETIFDPPPASLLGMTTLWESDRFRLLMLDWMPAPSPATPLE